MSIQTYVDGGRTYLELHALRAPVGGYYVEYENDPDLYDMDVNMAVSEFESDHGVEILRLGRSGRHICIEDTPENRQRYDALSTQAVAAARELWAAMREPE